MSNIRTLVKNTAALALAQLTTTGLRFFLTIFIARSIGDIDFGKLSFAQSFAGLLVIFADLGLSTVTIREIARKKEHAPKYLGNIYLIKLVLSLVAFALIALLINLLHYPEDTVVVVYIIGISAILSNLSELSRSIFRAFEKMEYEAFLNITKSAVTTGIGVILLFLGYGLITIAFVYLLASLTDLCATLSVTVRKFAKPKIEMDLVFWKQILALALPFSLTAFIGLIYTQIDIVMLSLMKGDAPVGWYRAASVLIFSLMGFADIFSFAVYPLMSRLYISSKEALKTTIEKSSKYLFIFSLPSVIGIILLSDRIIPLLYGETFRHSVIALQTLSLYLPLRCINNITGYTLSSIDKEPLHALSIVCAAISNIILNLLLIPKFSVYGAALSTTLTECILFSLYYFFVAKYFHRLRLGVIFLRPALASLAMGLLILSLKNINLGLLVISSIAFYFGLLYFIRGFDAEDKAMLKDLYVQ